MERAVQYAVDEDPTARAAPSRSTHRLGRQRGDVRGTGGGAHRLAIESWHGQRHLWPGAPVSVIRRLSGPASRQRPAAASGKRDRRAFSREPFDFGLRHAGVASAKRQSLVRGRTQHARARRRDGCGTRLPQHRRRPTRGDRAAGRRRPPRTSWSVRRISRRRPVAARGRGLRTDAELAAAQTRLIQAQEVVTLGRIGLARVREQRTLSPSTQTTLVDRLPADSPTAGPATHPLTQVRQAAVDLARAQEDVLSRTDLPRVYFQSSVFARGSGANPNGELDGGISGLGLDRANWAAGVQVVFPNAFDFTSLRARKAAAAASARAETALYDEAMLTVTSQQQAAAAMVQAARAVAANTPVQLAAARQSEAQATRSLPGRAGEHRRSG